MKDKKYVIVDLGILPDVYQKVLLAKELLNSGNADTVNMAADMAKVSRSAYYKYKDRVFPFNEMHGVVTLLATVVDMRGVLSGILTRASDSGCNVLTINQNVPINGVASITLTLQTDTMNLALDELISQMQSIHGVRKVEILAKQ